MKKLIVLFSLVLLTFSSFSQTTDDSTTISNAELEEVFNAIDVLTKQDSVKTVLINDLKNQINLYQTLSKQDSILLDYKNKQISILKETVTLYDDRLKQVDKWYKKPWVGFISGVATVSLSSWIIGNIIQ